MKIADRTPFRTENGTIDYMGRAQGTLKYGLSWYARLQAQEVVIAVLEKVLGANFVLLRNVTLPDTDIDLPLVLLGPPGIYLINVTHERGVYRARDDEWGTISGEKFVPAGINQLQRTVKLGKVLQVYLDRAGFKGEVIIDPILMAADPGMHIESVRPAARIVMSDALERFAISINQARPILSVEKIARIAQTIVNGPKKSEPAVSATAAPAMSVPTNGGRDTTDALFAASQRQDANSSFSADSLGFSFDDKAQEEQTPAGSISQSQRPANRQSSSTSQGSGWQNTPAPDGSSDFRDQGDTGQDMGFRSNNFGDVDLRNAVFQDDDSQTSGSQAFEAQAESGTSGSDQPATQPETAGEPRAASAGKKRRLGMTTKQLMILGAILLVWLCSMAVFAAFIYFNA